MTTWQRRLRAAIAVFGVGFAILVYFAIREGRPPAAADAPVSRVDRAAAAESIGGEALQLKGTQQEFRVEYDRSLSYPDGRQRMIGARVFVTERAGRAYTLTGVEAEVGAGEDRIDFRGGVTLKSDDGLEAQAPEATYTQSEGVMRASGGAAFSEGRVSGRSSRLTYDKNRDVLWMLDEAALDMAPDSAGDSPVHIESANAGLARRDHYARFDGGFTLRHGARELHSEVATAYLSEDQSKVQVLEMRGQASVAGLGAETGALRSMRADAINVEFAEDGRTLRGATLAEHASIDVGSASGDPRRIAARWIELRLADDGVTVTTLSARDDVRLDLPAEGTQGAKTLLAATLAASGEGGAGLSAATLTGGVEYRETPPGAKATRLARADTMRLTMEAGFGSVDDARFEGTFSFEEDQVRAQAAEASYQVSDGVIALSGADPASGANPRVTDGRAAIEGARVTLTLQGRKVSAEEKVRTVLLPMAGAAASGGAAQKRSSMLEANAPVYAASDSLSYDGDARRASFKGSARLWQGDTAIQGDELTIDDATGNLAARGQVRSTLMLETSAAAEGTGGRRPTIARADSLTYDEAGRKVSYLRNAQVSGPQGDLRAGRVEVVLSASGKGLGRVEAYTSVALQEGDRQATGERLTYHDAEGKYTMEGAPVRILAQCRDIAGRTLTFFRSADTIIVDGNQEIRTQTKGGAACGERRAP